MKDIKTFKKWEASGLSIPEFFHDGDLTDEEMFTYLGK